MGNLFDKYDSPTTSNSSKPSGNLFDKYDSQPSQPKSVQPTGTPQVHQIPSDVGGGAYNFFPNQPDALTTTPRGYAGMPVQPGQERDHIMPVSLGGASTPSNLQMQPGNPNQKGTPTGNKDTVEHQALQDYLAGKISLGDARNQMLTYNYNQVKQPPKTTADFFLSSLGDTVKGLGQNIVKGMQGIGEGIKELTGGAMRGIRASSQLIATPFAGLAGLTEKNPNDPNQSMAIPAMKESLKMANEMIFKGTNPEQPINDAAQMYLKSRNITSTGNKPNIGDIAVLSAIKLGDMFGDPAFSLGILTKGAASLKEALLWKNVGNVVKDLPEGTSIINPITHEIPLGDTLKMKVVPKKNQIVFKGYVKRFGTADIQQLEKQIGEKVGTDVQATVQGDDVIVQAHPPSPSLSKSPTSKGVPLQSLLPHDQTPVEQVKPPQPVSVPPDLLTNQKSQDAFIDHDIKSQITQNGFIDVSGDRFKELNGNDFVDENKPVYGAMKHRAALRAIDLSPSPDVAITAGGPGSGKTEFIVNALKQSGFQGVHIEGTLAHLPRTLEIIEYALKKGKHVHIDSLLVDLKKAWGYTLDRQVDTGRGVTLNEFLDMHQGYIDTMKHLIEKYPNLDITLRDTRGVNGGKEAIDKLPRLKDRQVLLDKLNEVRYDKNALTQELSQYENNRRNDRKYQSTTPTSGQESPGGKNSQIGPVGSGTPRSDVGILPQDRTNNGLSKNNSTVEQPSKVAFNIKKSTLTKDLFKSSKPQNNLIEEAKKYTSADELQKEIDTKIEKTRREMGLMVSNEKAGVRTRLVTDANGGFKFLANDFKLNRAKSDMARRAGQSKEYVHNYLMENDPEYQALVKALNQRPKPPIVHHTPDEIMFAEAIPGLSKTIEHDIIPAGKNVREMFREVKGAVTPSKMSSESQRTADIVREAKAEIANQGTVERIKSKKYSQFFAKVSDEENIANISQYERTGQFANAPEGYSELYKQSIEASRKILQEAYGADRVGYVENYVRRQFEFGSKADEIKGTNYLTNRSLSASKSPLKGRVLNMPLDEALADMKARGINVKMATSNPETLRQWSIGNARQAQAYAQVWHQLKDGGLIKFVKLGGRPPETYVPLADNAAKVFFPTDAGLTQGGQYYADPNVARVLNNTISRGLGASSIFKGARYISNSLNQLQLGFSAFHFTGTAINAAVSDLALSMRQIAQGKVVTAGKSIGRSVVPFSSFARDAYNGNKIIEGLKNNSPEAYQFLKEKLNPAGGRLNIDSQYTNSAYERMMTALRNGNYLGALGRTPFAALEAVSKPLMEYAIPRVKIGAFMDLANEIVSKVPNATETELHRAYAEAWDSIDNRFGQLVYDNLFWNKTLKDVGMLSTRSVGWNLGTIRELGGGAKDTFQTVRGKGVTDRTLYALALPLLIGVYGAVYHYLHTGKKPSKLKDYFAPENGLTNSSGEPQRVVLPSYMKDVYAYSTNPLQTLFNKTSPLLDMALALGKNRDYYGDMIRNPDDPTGKQLEQTGQYLVRAIQPFSIQQMMKSKSEGATFEQKLESFMGIVNAPSVLMKTPRQLELEKLFTAMHPKAPLTPEQKDEATLKSKARQELKSGDTTSLKELVQGGYITSAKSLQSFLDSAQLTGDERMFKGLSAADKKKVLETE